MPDMLNTHYNLIDTLIILDRENFNLALEIVTDYQFKAEMNLHFGLKYIEEDVLALQALILEKKDLNGAHAITIAECALFAFTQRYRHEPR